MPLRIPHKGKNKGKYISFHYLRGWKAREIRKVQEISPQITIYKKENGEFLEKEVREFSVLLFESFQSGSVYYGLYSVDQLQR